MRNQPFVKPSPRLLYGRHQPHGTGPNCFSKMSLRKQDFQAHKGGYKK